MFIELFFDILLLSGQVLGVFMLFKRFLLLFLCFSHLSIKPDVSEFLGKVKDAVIDAGKATLETAQDTALSVKKSTWDAKAFGYKDGGKYVTSLVAATLAADYAYTYYVNKSKAYYETKRPTIHERIKNYWDSIDNYYKELIINTSLTIVVSAILFKIQMGSASENHFDATDSSDLTTTFNDIIGSDSPKKEISRYLDYIKNPDKYKGLLAKPLKGIVLHGPPGTGKTELARATAKEAGVSFIHTTGSDFNGIFRGSGTDQVRRLQKAAEKNAPCVVFIDEMEAAVGNSSGPSFTHLDDQGTTNKFKTWLDGFSKQNSTKPIFVIGATNNLDRIDKAIIRDGRLTPIKVPAPNKADIEKIFNVKLKDSRRAVDSKIDITSLTDQVYKPGYTGADAQALIDRAAMCAIDSNKAMIDYESFQQAISEVEKFKPSLG